jgi:hypothetical protein
VSDRRITFTRDFDWSPPEKGGRLTIAYKAGWSGLVRKACAIAAVKAGAAIKGDEHDRDR